jgi:hypothetical protein
MFLSQVYFLELSQSFKIHLFIKLVIFSILAFFLKLYAVLIFIYLILFLNKYKKIFDFFRNNLKLFSFLFAIIILTFFKTFITTGCVIYPEPKTCFEKDTIEWSNGKKLTEYRKDFLSAWSKGWKVYLKSTDYNYLISPEEYLNKHKFSYLFFTFQDKDYERILVPIIILLLFIVLNLFNKIKKIEKLNNKNKFSSKRASVSISKENINTAFVFGGINYDSSINKSIEIKDYFTKYSKNNNGTC